MNEIMIPPHVELWPRRAYFKKLLWSAAGACALGGLYALRLEDHWLRIERRPMPLPDLGSEFDGAKIAHISDLHCSPLVLSRYLRQCVERINALEVDFVAITGDFITGARRHARKVAGILKHLAPKVATVACLGNHDYGVLHPSGLGGMSGLEEYIAEQLSRADIFVMRNEPRVFRRGAASLQFVGVDDLWTEHYDPPLAFADAHGHLPTIGLAHNPDAAPALAECGADWVLAGHTHGTASKGTRLGGLVFPVKHRKYVAGHYRLAGEKNLYVNRGLGYGRRVRDNARPEITLFALVGTGG